MISRVADYEQSWRISSRVADISRVAEYEQSTWRISSRVADDQHRVAEWRIISRVHGRLVAE